MSLINVSLGYALAVYVNRARMRAADAAQSPLLDALAETIRAEQPAQEGESNTSAADHTTKTASSENRRTDERNATWLASDDAPSLTQAATLPVEIAAPPAAAASSAAMASEATMVEKDLLAGIEEFRLQLAKIKGHAEGEPLAEALGVTVAGK
jgi:hypothetical protein